MQLYSKVQILRSSPVLSYSILSNSIQVNSRLSFNLFHLMETQCKLKNGKIKMKKINKQLLTECSIWRSLMIKFKMISNKFLERKFVICNQSIKKLTNLQESYDFKPYLYFIDLCNWLILFFSLKFSNLL